MKKLISFLVVAVILLSSCGQEKTQHANTGYVDTAYPENLYVTSVLGKADVEADGTFNVPLPEDSVSLVTVSDKHTNKPVYYAYSFFSDYLTIDDTSTAIAITMLNPLFTMTSSDEKYLIAERIERHPDFYMLVENIESARDADFLMTLDEEKNQDIFIEAFSLAYASNFPEHQAGFSSQAVHINSDIAWLSSVSGLNMVFKNSQTMFYAGASFDTASTPTDANMIDAEPTLIYPRQKIIDFSVDPPVYEFVEPRETPYTMPGSETYYVHVYNGFDSTYWQNPGDPTEDIEFQEAWDITVNRTALFANIWMVIRMIVSLTGDISILPEVDVGVDIVNDIIGGTDANDWVCHLFQNVYLGSTDTVSAYFVQFFKDNSTDIENLITGPYAYASSDPAAAASLVNAAATTTGSLSLIWYNNQIPVNVDITASHYNAHTYFPVTDGQIHDNMPDPVPSQTDPVTGLPDSSYNSCSTYKSTNNNVVFAIIVVLGFYCFRKKTNAAKRNI